MISEARVNPKPLNEELDEEFLKKYGRPRPRGGLHGGLGEGIYLYVVGGALLVSRKALEKVGEELTKRLFEWLDARFERKKKPGLAEVVIYGPDGELDILPDSPGGNVHHVTFSRISMCLLFLLAATVRGAERGPLRAGAARVDITPAAGAALPMSGYANRTQGFKGIHDHIYVRAIVLDDGATQAAVVAWELIFAPDAVWAEVSRRVAAESGIRPENLLLAGVHDHGAPSIGVSGGAAATAEYTRKVEDAAVEAVRRAKEHLQPARFGAGSGTAYINANRRELTPSQGWWLGYNENGVSDKTVAVLRFEDLSGRPIAFFINYPVHAVIMGPENYQITGDLAGATSRFVERHYLGEDRPRSDAGHRLRLRPEEKAGDGGRGGDLDQRSRG